MNGAAWCATQVDSAGTVVDNMWEDCKPECPRNDGTGEGELLFISDSFLCGMSSIPPLQCENFHTFESLSGK